MATIFDCFVSHLFFRHAAHKQFVSINVQSVFFLLATVSLCLLTTCKMLSWVSELEFKMKLTRKCEGFDIFSVEPILVL
jgi:hypothetical protein